MAMSRGIVSYTPYRVRSGPSDRMAVLDGLIRGRIAPIDVAAGRDRAIGFAVFEDPLDTEFTEEKVFFDPLTVFCIRADRLGVPPSTLRLHVRRRVTEALAATRRQKLPREEREQIEQQVREDLLRRAVPAITACEVVWETRSNRVRLSSTSASLNEEFLTLAREFLELELEPMNLVGVLEDRLDDQQVDQAYHLLPSSFIPAPAAARRPVRPEEEA